MRAASLCSLRHPLLVHFQRVADVEVAPLICRRTRGQASQAPAELVRPFALGATSAGQGERRRPWAGRRPGYPACPPRMGPYPLGEQARCLAPLGRSGLANDFRAPSPEEGEAMATAAERMRTGAPPASEADGRRQRGRSPHARGARPFPLALTPSVDRHRACRSPAPSALWGPKQASLVPR